MILLGQPSPVGAGRRSKGRTFNWRVDDPDLRPNSRAHWPYSAFTVPTDHVKLPIHDLTHGDRCV